MSAPMMTVMLMETRRWQRCLKTVMARDTCCVEVAADDDDGDGNGRCREIFRTELQGVVPTHGLPIGPSHISSAWCRNVIVRVVTSCHTKKNKQTCYEVGARANGQGKLLCGRKS